jgi:hypothetical protein
MHTNIGAASLDTAILQARRRRGGSRASSAGSPPAPPTVAQQPWQRHPMHPNSRQPHEGRIPPPHRRSPLLFITSRKNYTAAIGLVLPRNLLTPPVILRRANGVTPTAWLRNSDMLPNVPVLSDFIPDFQAGSWWGLAAPKNTPHKIIHVLSHATNAVLSDPGIKARLAKLGTTPLLYGPAPFASFVEIETDKWARVLKYSGIKEG